MKGRAALVAVLALSLAAAGCKRRVADETGAEPHAAQLPALSIGDETPDLLLTWVDAKGDAHTAVKPADVPIEGRDQVRVVVTTNDDGTHDLFYVANLTVKNADGTYPVSSTPRSEWDAMIAKRRAARLAAAMPAPPASAPAPGTPSPGASAGDVGKAPAVAFTVIVYGASWCGACHEAVAYLKKRRVPVVEKDIEEDPAAGAEMQKKLARAGMRGGSIPVIDVRGKLLVGFEPHALDQAVAAAAGGTAL